MKEYLAPRKIVDRIKDCDLKNPVYVIGNGLNESVGAFSDGWNGFIRQLARCLFGHEYPKYASELENLLDSKSVTSPEVYDWILIRYAELKMKDGGEKMSEKRAVNKILNQYLSHQQACVSECAKNQLHEVSDYCRKHGIPVLTTNYDSNLVGGADWGNPKSTEDCFFPKSLEKNASRWYPFSCYYSPEQLDDSKDILKQFAIWHINGMTSYEESLRLNARDYSYMAGRVREYLEDFKAGNLEMTNNWVKLFMNGDLIFVGMSLESEESILRWLLIERRRYFLGKQEAPKAIYIRYNRKKKESDEDERAKEILFDALGVKILDLAPGEDIVDIFKDYQD